MNSTTGCPTPGCTCLQDVPHLNALAYTFAHYYVYSKQNVYIYTSRYACVCVCLFATICIYSWHDYTQENMHIFIPSCTHTNIFILTPTPGHAYPGSQDRQTVVPSSKYLPSAHCVCICMCHMITHVCMCICIMHGQATPGVRSAVAVHYIEVCRNVCVCMCIYIYIYIEGVCLHCWIFCCCTLY